MTSDGTFEAYSDEVISRYGERDTDSRHRLLNEVRDLKVRSVLDLGCGPGQELIPFIENTDAVCVGVDEAEGLGRVALPFFNDLGLGGRVHMVRAAAESLPFAAGSFDLLLCRVALPYMHNRRAIAEMARVLSPGGTLLLRVHAPMFYLSMLGGRARNPEPRQIAYPLISLGHGLWHELTGHQARSGFWKGKEIFQSRRFLKRELGRHGLSIASETEGSSREAPSFLIKKVESIER
ncbi:MAG: class I SAM-dependent methyltransferase [Acidobacteriota bacterium]